MWGRQRRGRRLSTREDCIAAAVAVFRQMKSVEVVNPARVDLDHSLRRCFHAIPNPTTADCVPSVCSLPSQPAHPTFIAAQEDYSMHSVNRFSRTAPSAWLAGCAMTALLTASSASAQAPSPFLALAGSWSGGGQLKLEDGRSEKLSCRAFYTAKDGGVGLGIALRCASTSYKIELRSTLRYAGGRVTGTWEERSFNVGGSIAGRASSGVISMAFTGGANGTLSVNYGNTSQRVSITTGGAGFSNVSVSLSKG